MLLIKTKHSTIKSSFCLKWPCSDAFTQPRRVNNYIGQDNMELTTNVTHNVWKNFNWHKMLYVCNLVSRDLRRTSECHRRRKTLGTKLVCIIIGCRRFLFTSAGYLLWLNGTIDLNMYVVDKINKKIYDVT